MPAMVAVYTSEPMVKVSTLQEFFYNLGNNGSPEPILSFITFIVHLYKLLKVISDTLIKRAILRRARTVYAHLFCHFG
jgi:hypothetical protein